MLVSRLCQFSLLIGILSLGITGCAHQGDGDELQQRDYIPSPTHPSNSPEDYPYAAVYDESKYPASLPQTIETHEKVIMVDPKVYAWGAYDATGQLIKGGIASAGADYCPDDDGPCRTTPGTFRIYAEKGEECVSKIYPRPEGGSKMPYCMFFNQGQSLHGSPDHILTEQNISHGCIHMRIPDAEWLENNFAKIGTKVVILPY